MLHGAGIFSYIYPKNDQNVGKNSSTMEHLPNPPAVEHHYVFGADFSWNPGHQYECGQLTRTSYSILWFYDATYTLRYIKKTEQKNV